MQEHKPLSDENNYEKNRNLSKRLDGSDSLTIAADRRLVLASGPTVIILQWFTYAFWIGVIIATSIVLNSVLSFYMLNSTRDLDYSSLYGVASLIVLLPLAIICDIFYSKRESDKKSTFSSVIMIIHAVGLAMIGVGSLILTVLSVVNLIINNNDSAGTLVTLYSSLSVTILSLIVLLRVVAVSKSYLIKRYFIALMSLVVGFIIAISFVGPVGSAWSARGDKFIENNLPGIVEAVSRHVDLNKKLPNNLEDIKVKGDVEKLISNNQVDYRALNNKSVKPGNEANIFYYELCVVYKRDTSDRYGDYYSPVGYPETEYSSYISTDLHKSGKVCYKISVNSGDYGDGSVMPMRK